MSRTVIRSQPESSTVITGGAVAGVHGPAGEPELRCQGQPRWVAAAQKCDLKIVRTCFRNELQLGQPGLGSRGAAARFRFLRHFHHQHLRLQRAGAATARISAG